MAADTLYKINEWFKSEISEESLQTGQAIKDFYENAELVALTKELTETLRQN